MENRINILKLKQILREKKFVVGVPTIIKFKTSNKQKPFSEYKATKGTEVIKWNDFLKATREI